MANKIHSSQLATFQKLSQSEGAQVYARLREDVIAAGLLKRQYGYYAVHITSVYVAFFATLVAIYFSSNSFLIIFLSILSGVAAVQIAGLIHDAGHREIFATSRNNDIFGQICSFVLGTGYGNWRVSHDRHHAKPNQDGFDPDIEVPFSFTIERMKNSTGLGRLIAKYQAYVYYPLGTLTSLSLRFKRMTYFKENWGPKIYLECGLFALSVVLHYALPFYFFGLAKGLLFLVTITPFEGLYLFNVFAPNHKGMPELDGDVKLSFLEQQIVTARNIPSSPLIDWIYMGLNTQIEHHLFPNCPRNNLKRVVPYVKAVCEEHGIEYTETGAIESNIIIFNEMRKASALYT